jgi:Xaa-Pro aminopeptidase
MNADHARRCSLLQQCMEEQDIDCVILTPSPSFQYLTGIDCDWRNSGDSAGPLSTLLIQRGKPVELILEHTYVQHTEAMWIDDIYLFDSEDEYQRVALTLFEDNDTSFKKIALSQKAPVIDEFVHAHFDSIEITGADTLLDTQRLIKESGEIDILRNAAAITDKVMGAVVPLIREGVTQIDLEEAIKHYGRQFGADDVSFSPGALFVLSGSEVSDNPFTYPKDEGLVPGTSVAFDFGFLVDGYCSDFGRSFYFGPAGEEVENAYHALGRSVEELAGLMYEDSMTTGDLFSAIEKILDGYGFGDYLRARLKTGNLGHQIGIDVHENPWLTPESDTPLTAGMVMAVEPKLWHAGEYYLRVEDIVLVGQDHTEFLTTFDRELFQL